MALGDRGETRVNSPQRNKYCIWVLLVLVLAGCADSEIPCVAVDGVQPICGLQAPEDLVLTPDGRYLLFSQYAPGASLGVLDTVDDSVRFAYPEHAGGEEASREWGSADCPGPVGEDILAHGLDLGRRPDGRWQLLAVNHGGRESVEFFEVIIAPDSPPELHWRGCAPAPQGTHFNDVVMLPGGGFLVTHMFDSRWLLVGMAKTALGLDSGTVYRWDETGYQPLEPTAAPFPNGIALAGDGEHLFVNIYGEGEVRKYRMSDLAQVGVAPVPGPDNLSWAGNGKLLVASHRYNWRKLTDGLPPPGGGPGRLRFAIVAIDPQTMDSKVILEREGAPMGAATVAVEAAGYLYLGSFMGDRMIKVPLEQLRW